MQELHFFAPASTGAASGPTPGFRKRRRATALICALAPLFLANAAHAQATYPSKPVRIVVPFAPGGGADVVGRLLAQRLSEGMRAQFVVDNKSGAGGVIGTDIVAKAQPDGHTLLLAPSSHVVNPSVFTKLPYDTQTAFEPVSLVASATVLLAANGRIAAKDLKSSSPRPSRETASSPTTDPLATARCSTWLASSSSVRPNCRCSILPTQAARRPPRPWSLARFPSCSRLPSRSSLTSNQERSFPMR